MQELSGGAVRDWVEDAAVVGIWEVLKRYSWFRARFEETRCEIEELSPDAVVFVDYPGFNLQIPVVLANLLMILLTLGYFTRFYPSLKLQGY